MRGGMTMTGVERGTSHAMLALVVRALLAGPLGLVVFVLTLTAVPAHAIDSARTAVSLVQQAAKAYETGDFVRAADLYQKAWRLDPSPAYLWALARAEHLSGQYEPAMDHYRQFTANPGSESARVPKAQGYIAELETEMLKGRLRDAEGAIRSGNPALAAELFLQAYKLVPTRHQLLFKAAVAEQMAENWQGALDHYDRYLSLAPDDAEDRAQAISREAVAREKLGKKPLRVVERTDTAPVATVREEVSAREEVRGETPANTIKPVSEPVEAGVHQKAPAPQGPRWPGWTGVAGGGALAIVATVLLVSAQTEASQLDKDQSHAAGELITTISREEAVNRASAINTRAAIGWTAAGLGVAAGAFGAWWLASHPAETAVVLPTANGAALLVRF